MIVIFVFDRCGTRSSPVNIERIISLLWRSWCPKCSIVVTEAISAIRNPNGEVWVSSRADLQSNRNFGATKANDPIHPQLPVGTHHLIKFRVDIITATWWLEGWLGREKRAIHLDDNISGRLPSPLSSSSASMYVCTSRPSSAHSYFINIILSIIMDGVQNLPPHLQGEFMKTLEQMQMKDSLV